MKIKCLFLFLAFAATSFAQKRYYDVIAFDKNVGEVSVAKQKLDANSFSMQYRFDAKIKVLFITTVIDMNLNGTYKNSRWNDLDVFYKQNDKVVARDFNWDGNKYKVDSKGKQSELSRDITFSVLDLYYREPVGVKEVFLARQNKFMTLESMGNHQYKAVVDGDKCLYTYKNGILQSLKIDGIVDLVIKLRE